MAFDRSGKFAFARGGRLLVVFAGAQLGEQPGFLHGAFEAAQRDLKRLIFLDSNRRHRMKYFPCSC